MIARLPEVPHLWAVWGRFQPSPLHQSSSTGSFRPTPSADGDLMGDWGSTLAAPQPGAMHRNASQPNLSTAGQPQTQPARDPFADLGQSPLHSADRRRPSGTDRPARLAFDVLFC